MAENGGMPKKAAAFFVAFEILMIVLYALFVRHESPSPALNPGSSSIGESAAAFNVGAYSGNISITTASYHHRLYSDVKTEKKNSSQVTRRH